MQDRCFELGLNVNKAGWLERRVTDGAAPLTIKQSELD